VTPRRFAAFFHAARVPRSRPAELSLPGEPHPLSRAVASLRVRGRPPPTRRTRELRGRFPHPAGPVAARGPEAPGRLRGRESAFPRSLRSGKSELFRLRPPDRSLARRDSPVDAAVTPAAKLCSPRESVPATPHPGRVRNVGPVLSWAFLPLQSLLQNDPGFGLSRATRARLGLDTEPRRKLGRLARVARPALRPRGLDPGIRRPGGCATTVTTARQRLDDPHVRVVWDRSSPAARTTPAGVTRATFGPCPLSAAPRASRPRPPPPARGDGSWASETHWKDRAGGPPSREGDQLS
jgi:hypothetical protein